MTYTCTTSDSVSNYKHDIAGINTGYQLLVLQEGEIRHVPVL